MLIFSLPLVCPCQIKTKNKWRSCLGLHIQIEVIMNTYFLAALVASFLFLSACGGDSSTDLNSISDTPPKKLKQPPVKNIGNSVATTNHFIPKDGAISIGSKSLANNQQAKIFIDQYNRERTFRGFNVTGSVKLRESGFKPFRNELDARDGLKILRDQIGSNMIRFTLAWEGMQPEPNKVDTQYLAELTKQIKVAIEQKIYILLDYHTDLYSRYVFRKDSAHTGNGAPKWAVSDIYGKDDCSLPCMFTWSAHTLSNSAVRNVVKSFWYDLWALDKSLNSIEVVYPKTNQCLGIKDSKAVFSTCNNSSQTKWSYNKQGVLKNTQGQCLDVVAGLATKGATVRPIGCNGSRAQQFIISKKGQLHSLSNLNLCVGVTNKGLNLDVCRPEPANQIWQLRDNNQQSIMAQLNYIQSQFTWQMGELISYLEKNLSQEELDYIVGINPINEPYDGGVKPEMTYKQWDNLILWPAYESMRKEMIARGWQAKQLYAEPLVFWSSIAGIFAPATGAGHLDYKPDSDGFVFNSHFYDQARMGTSNKPIDNGTYFGNIDKIRNEARYLNLAPFVSEFGMWNGEKGHRDSARTNNAVYQALEATNESNNKALNTGSQEVKKRSRRLDFYAPVVSGTQWHWGYYYNNHKEYQNDNLNQLKTKHDAWNDEDFSVIDNFGKTYLLPQKVLERVYPRAVQGDIMHFAYDPKAADNSGKAQPFYSIKGSILKGGDGFEILKDTPFALLTWRGRRSDAPTEIFVPRHIDVEKLVVITDARISTTLSVSNKPNGEKNEILLTKDISRQGGHNLYIWDDKDKDEHNESYHFALMYLEDEASKKLNRNSVQFALKTLINKEVNPVYLIDKMTDSGYSKK